MKNREKIVESIPYLMWATALIATLGSLYFSEILKFQPCVLCWYQRILMYPIVLILLVDIIRKDKDFIYRILPLSVLGWIISFYHNLLYYNILPESAAPCSSGVSCTAKYIEYFGFVTIPLLALIAFSIINVLIIIKLINKKYE